MNKQTKVLLLTLLGLLSIIFIVLLFAVIRQDKLEEEYTRYKYIITDFAGEDANTSEYTKIIEYCIENDMSTEIYAWSSTEKESVPDFVLENNIVTYYTGYYNGETVWIYFIDGEIVSNLEEVKRYFE